MNLKILYIGAVSLLCRVYRADHDVENAEAMELLARDFNAQGLGLVMTRAGDRWALFERKK